METFYNNIKTATTRVYRTPVTTYQVFLRTNAPWAQYKIDGSAWSSYKPDGEWLTLSAGSHIFEFRSSAGWAAPQDFTYSIQENKYLYVVYKQSYSILMDHLENFQFGDIFIT
jgi:hypothetical protein